MDGIIVVDKPEGFTSFDVIAKLRGMFRIKKMGHSGTLDPMATGVLPVFIGKATKAVDIIPNDRKSYRAEVRLGIRTDTGDITGKVIDQNDIRPEPEQLINAANRKTGITEQIPPMYSAVKINGQRLYSLARQGKEIERKPRQVKIDKIRISDFDGDRFTCEVYCRKGLYVRTLAEDIAGDCGCLATLTGLRRTQSGSFSESDAVSLEEIQTALDNGTADSLIRPVDTVFSDYMPVELNEKDTRRFLNGVQINREMPDGCTVRVYSGNDFLGLAYTNGGILTKMVQFYNSEK